MSLLDQLEEHPFRTILLGTLALVVGLAVPIEVGGYLVGVKQCSDVSSQTGLSTKYTYWTGCYVRLGDEWVPVERWRKLQ